MVFTQWKVGEKSLLSHPIGTAQENSSNKTRQGRRRYREVYEKGAGASGAEHIQAA